jgi:hypothetical protein
MSFGNRKFWDFLGGFGWLKPVCRGVMAGVGCKGGIWCVKQVSGILCRTGVM